MDASRRHPLLLRLRRAALALAVGRALRSFLLLAVYVVAGVALATLLAKVGWIPERSEVVALGGSVLALVLAAWDGSRIGLSDGALALDRRLGLGERAVTALEAIRGGRHDALAERVKAEAFERVPANPFGLFRLDLARRGGAVVLVLLALLGVRAIPQRVAGVAMRETNSVAPLRAEGRKLAERARKLEAEMRRAALPEALPAVHKLKSTAQGLAGGKVNKTQALASVRDARKAAHEAALRSPLVRALPHFDKAMQGLESAAPSQELAEAMRAGDADAVSRRMEELAKALEKGGFEAASLKPMAQALDQMAEALAAAGRKELAESARAAAAAAGKGDAKGLAEALRKMKEGGAGQFVAQEGKAGKLQNEMASLVHSLEGSPGVRFEPLSGADYGIGSTDEEEAARPVAGGHRVRDRELPFRTHETREFRESHDPRLLAADPLKPTRVPGQAREGGELSYVEVRAAAGPARLTVARGAVPGSTVESTEDALSREEIPPGYRDQIKTYFDRNVAAPSGSGAAPKDGKP